MNAMEVKTGMEEVEGDSTRALLARFKNAVSQANELLSGEEPP